ncbi:hypothetical protein Vadar_019193 [Vaccinium darrowii]|uniref:Uncharacterized protein n=1 Tax=Vaccinium darrowii TaxID=229202 RepID=A0ACB7XIL7_9ERIC|nr:hypothetical protein Vadar_019193 [Vaccinium darrowii]
MNRHQERKSNEVGNSKRQGRCQLGGPVVGDRARKIGKLTGSYGGRKLAREIQWTEKECRDDFRTSLGRGEGREMKVFGYGDEREGERLRGGGRDSIRQLPHDKIRRIRFSGCHMLVVPGLVVWGGKGVPRWAFILASYAAKTEDYRQNGYVIPRGWRIYVYTREINYDPFLYPEPQVFNPWRWLDMVLKFYPGKELGISQLLLLVWKGNQACPGKELGIVTIAIFVHYFVTRYRWEEVGEEKLLKFPRVEAPNGLHVRVSKY